MSPSSLRWAALAGLLAFATAPARAGEAVLTGPLAGSAVRIYAYPAVSREAHLAHTGVAANAGRFSVPVGVLTDTALYLVVVQGGTDIDADGAGMPAVNRGSLHAVATGAQIRSEGFRVSVVTEMAFQRVAFQMAARAPAPSLLAELQRRARLLLTRDLDGDGSIGQSDFARWAREPGSIDVDDAEVRALEAELRFGRIPIERLLAATSTLLAQAPTGRVGAKRFLAAGVHGAFLHVVYEDPYGFTPRLYRESYDIRVPGKLTLFHAASLPDDIEQLVFHESTLLYRDPYRRLIALSLASPRFARETSRLDAVAGESGPMTVDGDTLLVPNVNCGYNRIRIVDGVLTRTRNCPAASAPVADGAKFAAQHGEAVYFASATSVLVRDATGALTATLDVGQTVDGIWVTAGRLFVSTALALTEYDLVDPVHPAHLRRYPNLQSARGLSGTRLLVSQPQVALVDVSRPGDARVHRRTPLPAVVGPTPYIAVHPTTRRVFAAGERFVAEIDTRVDLPPPALETIPLGGVSHGMARDGALLHVVTGMNVETFLLSPSGGNATRQGVTPLQYGGFSIAAGNGHFYVNDGGSMTAYDASVRPQARRVSFVLSQTGTFTDVVWDSDHVVGVTNPFQTGGTAEGYDVSNPATPSFYSYDGTFDIPLAVALDGPRAVWLSQVEQRWPLLAGRDLAEPSRNFGPVATGDPTAIIVPDLELRGTTAYVPVPGFGVRTFDVSGDAPVQTSAVTGVGGTHLLLDGTFGLVSNGSGTGVIDYGSGAPFLRYATDWNVTELDRVGSHLVARTPGALLIARAPRLRLPGTKPNP